MNVGVSETVSDVVVQGLRIREIARFGSYSPCRGAHHLRDTMSGTPIIGSERVIANSAGLVLSKAQ